jgi:hypothetical protein
LSSHRTTARGIAVLLVAAATGLTAGGAAAWPEQPSPEKGPKPPAPPAPKQPAATPAPSPLGVPRLIFPVVGPVTYTDDFGDARGSGAHQGNDIVAPKRALAVAAEAGKVEYHTTSWRAGCMLYLHGKSGTTYLYVHLNNDRTKGNDNRGKCVPGVSYAEGLKDGARVAAGQPVGYVGDSGDADGITSHLHFEVHPKGKGAVSPYRYLRKARKLLFAAAPGTIVDLRLTGSIVEAFEEALTLRVDKLEAKPSGLNVAKVGRKIELALPPTVAVFNPLGALIEAVKLAQLKAGRPAVVATEPAEVTLATQLGAPLSLAAASIRLAD